MDHTSVKTVAQLLLNTGALSPEKVVTYCRVKKRLSEINYKKLTGMVLRMAAYLARRGVRRGDGLALYSDNCFEFWVVDFACQIAGIVSVVIHPLISTKKLAHILKTSQVKVCLAGEGFAKTVYDLRSEVPTLREIIAVAESPRTRFVTNFADALESVDIPPADRIGRMVQSVRPEDISVLFWTVQEELVPVAYTHEAVIRMLGILYDKGIVPDKQATVVTPFSHIDYCARLFGVYLPVLLELPFLPVCDIQELLSLLPVLTRVTLCGESVLFSSYLALVNDVKKRFFTQKPFHFFVHAESSRKGVLSNFFNDLDCSMSRAHYASKCHADKIAMAICWGGDESFSLSSLSREFSFPSHQIFRISLSPPLGRFSEELSLFFLGDTDTVLPCKYQHDIARGDSFKTFLVEAIAAVKKSSGLYEEKLIPVDKYYLPQGYFEDAIMHSRFIKRAVLVSNGIIAGVLIVADDSLASVRLKPSGAAVRIEEDLERISSDFIWKLPLKRFAVLDSEYAQLSREQIYIECSTVIEKMLSEKKVENANTDSDVVTEKE